MDIEFNVSLAVASHLLMNDSSNFFVLLPKSIYSAHGIFMLLRVCVKVFFSIETPEAEPPGPDGETISRSDKGVFLKLM